MALTPAQISEIRQAAAREGKTELAFAPFDVPSGACPPSWAGPLGQPDAGWQILDAVWRPVSAKLPRTIAAWKRCLCAIGLLSTAKRPPSLVYCYQRQGELFAFRGFAPTPVQRPEAAKLPQDFLEFFKVHNGFVDLFSASSGPLPDRDWYFLSEDPSEPAGQFLSVFSNGGGAHLGFDLAEPLPLAYIVWPDDPPSILTDIWATLDEWMSSGLEGADLAR